MVCLLKGSNVSLEETLGYCGLYCAGCGAFQATVAGRGVEYEPGKFTTCRGCSSDELSIWCTDCEIKTCAREKGVRYCLECGDFACDKIQGFMDDPEYPYHKDVPAAMARLAQVGLETWSAEQDARWNCPSCGARFDWFATACPNCGGAVSTRL
jgi:hypothetical protein